MMSTASASASVVDRAATDSTMSKSILDRFHAECEEYLRSELNTRLLASSSSATDKTASIHYLTEYQRCVDERTGFDSYIRERIASLDALKSCETAIDTFLERLKAIHEYECKQNEVFEQILHELTKLVRFRD
jgi:predicted nuclease with TOPRIM domain